MCNNTTDEKIHGLSIYDVAAEIRRLQAEEELITNNLKTCQNTLKRLKEYTSSYTNLRTEAANIRRILMSHITEPISINTPGTQKNQFGSDTDEYTIKSSQRDGVYYCSLYAKGIRIMYLTVDYVVIDQPSNVLSVYIQNGTDGDLCIIGTVCIYGVTLSDGAVSTDVVSNDVGYRKWNICGPLTLNAKQRMVSILQRIQQQLIDGGLKLKL